MSESIVPPLGGKVVAQTPKGESRRRRLITGILFMKYETKC